MLLVVFVLMSSNVMAEDCRDVIDVFFEEGFITDFWSNYNGDKNTSAIYVNPMIWGKLDARKYKLPLLICMCDYFNTLETVVQNVFNEERRLGIYRKKSKVYREFN